MMAVHMEVCKLEPEDVEKGQLDGCLDDFSEHLAMQPACVAGTSAESPGQAAVVKSEPKEEASNGGNGSCFLSQLNGNTDNAAGEQEMAAAKRRKKEVVHSKDLRSCFTAATVEAGHAFRESGCSFGLGHSATATATAAAAAAAATTNPLSATFAAAIGEGEGGGGGGGGSESASFQAAGKPSANIVLSALKLRMSRFQDVDDSALQAADRISSSLLQPRELVTPTRLRTAADVVPILTAQLPELERNGELTLRNVPAEWVDFTGHNGSLGTRCFFASRRHEHSIFKRLTVEDHLQVPAAAREWQPPLRVQCEATMRESVSLADEEPWQVQVHPAKKEMRLLVRPGILLLRMLRRGSAIPLASVSWRITDTSTSAQVQAAAGSTATAGQQSSRIGDFTILSNIEDAAHTQPPDFREYPLRREQLRSLGWMISQEQRRHDTFITELRESVPCPDAPHWLLECRISCEYLGVKGGVLADAIGYGKTACTIGLIDCSLNSPLPVVPSAFSGFIPSKATLVLAPTNLHSQWISEIKKFTGDKMKIISVPTCAQLKALKLKDIVEADVVVATYRLFYSNPYLRRLQDVVRTQKKDFAFPKFRFGDRGHLGRTSFGGQHKTESNIAEFERLYQAAFELLPGWSGRLQAKLPAISKSFTPVTPAKTTPAKGKGRGTAFEEASAASVASAAATPGDNSQFTETPMEKGPGRRGHGHEEKGSEQDDILLVKSSMEQTKRRRLTGKQPSNAVKQELAIPSEMMADSYVPLEAFWWKRVVCDEFHELIDRYPPAQVAVKLFHGDYKWGLSGTPPCQTLSQIRKAAGFLGVQLPKSSSVDETAEEPRKVAQEWLDAFVRRNTAELPDLEEEERIVPVHQTPKERALYLALTGEDNGSSTASHSLPPSLLGAGRDTGSLLKLCSHFNISGTSGEVTADDECENQVNLRRHRVQEVEKHARMLAERAAQLTRAVRSFEPHFCQRPQRKDYPFLLKATKPALSARLKFLGLPTTGTKPELLDRLLGSKDSGAPEALVNISERAKNLVLAADFVPKKTSLAVNMHEDSRAEVWTKLLKAAAEAPEDNSKCSESLGRNLVVGAVRQYFATCSVPTTSLPTRCSQLRSKLGMPKYPASNADDHTKAAFETENAEWLQDSHNGAKLRRVTEDWKEEIYRSAAELAGLELQANQKILALNSFQESLQASQSVATAPVAGPIAISASDVTQEEQAIVETGSSLLNNFAKYGSKIEALVKHVQQLNLNDPFCKIICFVQWEDLKNKISSALSEFKVEHVVLQGSVWARREVLTKFQYSEVGSPRLLLLSLEESASGTNLTAANHVIIVHPMEASTKDEAVAFEMQAVGRVRRPGQQKKIFIWRFVTMNTIEQKITEDHQKELWERQKTKITVSQPLEVINDEDLDSDGFDEAEAKETAHQTDLAYHFAATQRYLGDNAASANLRKVEAAADMDVDVVRASFTSDLDAPCSWDAQVGAVDHSNLETLPAMPEDVGLDDPTQPFGLSPSWGRGGGGGGR